VVVREKGEEFLAITQAVPADGAVTKGSHGELAVASDVDAPGYTGDGDLPLLGAVAVEETQMPISPEQEALAIQGNGHTAGGFIGRQLQGSAVEAGGGGVEPIADLQTGGRGDRGGQGTVRC